VQVRLQERRKDLPFMAVHCLMLSEMAHSERSVTIDEHFFFLERFVKRIDRAIRRRRRVRPNRGHRFEIVVQGGEMVLDFSQQDGWGVRAFRQSSSEELVITPPRLRRLRRRDRRIRSRRRP